jgi:hypothetical protein
MCSRDFYSGSRLCAIQIVETLHCNVSTRFVVLYLIQMRTAIVARCKISGYQVEPGNEGGELLHWVQNLNFKKALRSLFFIMHIIDANLYMLYFTLNV